MGGGVHLDLIHELDYAYWLFGEPKKITSFKKSNSRLNIESIDYSHFVLEYEYFDVNITLNYFRRNPKRSIEIVGGNYTYMTDLLENKIIELSDGNIVFASDQRVVDTYLYQMEYFIRNINIGYGSSFVDSINVLKIALS